MKPKKLIYLAMPYSSPDPAVVAWRLYEAARFIGQTMKHNPDLVLICTPLHFHPVAESAKLSTDADSWWDVNRFFIDLATEVWVLCLPHWDLSEGVRQEVDYADIVGKIVKMKGVIHDC